MLKVTVSVVGSPLFVGDQDVEPGTVIGFTTMLTWMPDHAVEKDLSLRASHREISKRLLLYHRFGLHGSYSEQPRQSNVGSAPQSGNGSGGGGPPRNW